ncbi:hypothetical protein NDU88_006534 [Pleurodeles waltl]|uniref:Uncharacterized protein n=1 Tax=Pleurodeles waltl TaxID=8319 RepID=A0AAV7MCI0_PLEWA|nr:hypothetical protein NDU88_006534 [Pleurodeles waltl]
MQSKPEGSEEEDLNEVDPGKVDFDLGGEDDLTLGQEQELPEEGDHLTTEREPGVEAWTNPDAITVDKRLLRDFHCSFGVVYSIASDCEHALCQPKYKQFARL